LTVNYDEEYSKYERAVRAFSQKRDEKHLADALILLSRIVRAEFARLDSRLKDLWEVYESLAEAREDIAKKVEGLEKDLSRLGRAVGALTESFYSQLFIDYLKSEGYRILRRVRNLSVDGSDIDLFVEAEKDGERYYFAVEVKVSAKHGDVGSLIAKAELLGERLGVRVIPVLVGAQVRSDVVRFAEERGVLVLTF